MSTLRETIAEIFEPQLVRPLGDIGFVGRVDEASALVELLLPFTNWPTASEIEAAIAAAAPGVTVTRTSMDADQLLALRNYLRGEMRGAAGPDRKSTRLNSSH